MRSSVTLSALSVTEQNDVQPLTKRERMLHGFRKTKVYANLFTSYDQSTLANESGI